MSAQELLEEDFEDDLIDVGGANEDDVELEIEDDTPEGDRNKPVAGAQTGDEDEDVEMAEYGEKVQARMRKITAQKHDERRAKEQAFRERDAAIAFAKDAHAKLQSASTVAAQATKASAESEIATLREEMRAAVELGDGEKVADLTIKLQQAANKLDGAKYAEARANEAKPPLDSVRAPQVSARQQEWVNRNQWFQTKPRMAAYALAVHQDLIMSGVAPESDLYYNEIDKEVRARFPEEFESSKSKPASQKSVASAPVSGVSRQAGQPGKKPKIVLTKSEVSIARQLGITPKEYAVQKAKLGVNQ